MSTHLARFRGVDKLSYQKVESQFVSNITMIHMHQNFVRMHRRSSGLSQRELAKVLGYGDQWQVSRHERAASTPTLRTAIAYEIVFRVPVVEIFIELANVTHRSVEASLTVLEEELLEKPRHGRDALTIAQKLQWIAERRNH